MPNITITRQVYYDDTDAGGVVYHTHYLKYMEHARTQYLQRRNYAPAKLAAEHNRVFAVTDITVKYLSPARLGDQMQVDAVLQDCGAVRAEFAQSIWLLNEQAEPVKKLVQAMVKVVCLDCDSFKPAKVPETVMESLLSEC